MHSYSHLLVSRQFDISSPFGYTKQVWDVSSSDSVQVVYSSQVANSLVVVSVQFSSK